MWNPRKLIITFHFHSTEVSLLSLSMVIKNWWESVHISKVSFVNSEKLRINFHFHSHAVISLSLSMAIKNPIRIEKYLTKKKLNWTRPFVTSAGYESHLKRLAAPFSHTRRASKMGAFKICYLLTFAVHSLLTQEGLPKGALLKFVIFILLKYMPLEGRAFSQPKAF